VRRTESSSAVLRRELELRLTHGRCAYCRIRASPERPLTREHLIPRSKGGGRKDHRIIVPACARCNSRRGSQELILFLLAQPRRISALLDHFAALPPHTLQHIDGRVFAELYAALWVLSECAIADAAWRAHLKRVCSGRTIHRRRYAARRIVAYVGDRLESRRARDPDTGGPSCLLQSGDSAMPAGLEEPLQASRARFMTLLALAWAVPAEDVEGEIRRARERAVAGSRLEHEDKDAAVRQTHGRKGRRRSRVDQRRGRSPRFSRPPSRRAA
jgi:hypothetical protein